MVIVFNCEKCNNIITTKKPVGRMKRCPQCGQVNLVPMNSEDVTESSNESLSGKYSILEAYKTLVYLLMLVSTGFTIYSFFQISDAGDGTVMDNTVITLIVTYVITMLSLSCLTKMIDFLFDLDKHKSDK